MTGLSRRLRLRWQDVQRFFLTSDGTHVVYKLIHDDTSDNTDEDDWFEERYFGYFPSDYGLGPRGLLELLNDYRQHANQRYTHPDEHADDLH